MKFVAEDLFHTPLDQAQIDFENEGGETYICGNPPYFGSRRQEDEQKSDLKQIASAEVKKWKSLDYVAGWLIKARDYAAIQPCQFAFVCTSSVSEGLQVSLIWSKVLSSGLKIAFCHRAFKWSNLAKNNAGVSVVIVGVAPGNFGGPSRIFDGDNVQFVSTINPYLVPATNVYVETQANPISALPRMVMESMPRDGGNLILSLDEMQYLKAEVGTSKRWLRKYLGSDEIISGTWRYCLWIADEDASTAANIPSIAARFSRVKEMRASSTLESTVEFADRPHRFVYLAGESKSQTVVIGGVSVLTQRNLLRLSR